MRRDAERYFFYYTRERDCEWFCGKCSHIHTYVCVCADVNTCLCVWVKIIMTLDSTSYTRLFILDDDTVTYCIIEHRAHGAYFFCTRIWKYIYFG